MAKSFKLKSGKVKSGLVKSGQVKSGQVRSGQVKSGQVRSGSVKSGQIKVRAGTNFSKSFVSDQVVHWTISYVYLECNLIKRKTLTWDSSYSVTDTILTKL